MATTYLPADDHARSILRGLIAEHRPDLKRAGVDIRLLFAIKQPGKSGLAIGPAMKSRGQRVLGKCKVNGLADREAGKTDVTITLDGSWWASATDRRRQALLHHEVSHIDLWDGERDEDGRPKLKAAHADWDFDGFHDLLDLYGRDSVEHANFERIARRHEEQLLLRFGDDVAGEPEVKAYVEAAG